MSSFRLVVIAGGALALVGGALGAGCGGTPAVDYSVETSFCEALAQADCSQPIVQACYGSGSNADLLAVDVQTCITFRTTPEVCNPLMLPYHGDFAQPCIDAHTAAYVNGQLDAAAVVAMTQGCLPVLNKAGAVTTQCTADTDCDVGSGLYCVTHQGAKGTCQTPTTVAPGSACTAAADECMGGYFCETSGYCVANPAKGAACSATVACGANLRCDATTNLCADQLQDGSPCTEPSDCTGGVCISTNSGGVCAATYTFAVGSATCVSFVPN
jgi:hypothetical protein